MSGDFAALVGRADRVAPAGNYEIVDFVFEWARRRDAEQERQIGLVLTKEQFSKAIEASTSGLLAGRECKHIAGADLSQPRAIRGAVPRPGVPGPKFRQHMQHCGFSGCVLDRDEYQDVIGIRLCIFNCNVEEASAAENPSIDEFELRLPVRTQLV